MKKVFMISAICFCAAVVVSNVNAIDDGDDVDFPSFIDSTQPDDSVLCAPFAAVGASFISSNDEALIGGNKANKVKINAPAVRAMAGFRKLFSKKWIATVGVCADVNASKSSTSPIQTILKGSDGKGGNIYAEGTVENKRDAFSGGGYASIGYLLNPKTSFEFGMKAEYLKSTANLEISYNGRGGKEKDGDVNRLNGKKTAKISMSGVSPVIFVQANRLVGGKCYLCVEISHAFSKSSTTKVQYEKELDTADSVVKSQDLKLERNGTTKFGIFLARGFN